MVSFIDWYLLRINASEREKIKVKEGLAWKPVDLKKKYLLESSNAFLY